MTNVLDTVRRSTLAVTSFLFVLILVPPHTSASTYYVDQRLGADTNPGTEGAPFRTINRAAWVMGPGDTTYIKAGVYNERIEGASGAPGAPITFARYGTDAVVIEGSRVPTGWVLATPAPGPVYKVRNWTPPRATFVLQDETTWLVQKASVAAMTAGSWFYDAGAATLYVWTTDGASPTNHQLDAAYWDTAFSSSVSGGQRSYITLRGLGLRKQAANAIYVGEGATAVGWELDGIEVSYVPHEGVFAIGGGEGMADWYVHDSRFHHNLGSGLQVNGNRARILRNESYLNEWGGPYQDGACGIIVSGHSAGTLVKDNVVHHNGTGYGCGIYLETIDTTGTIVESNDVYANFTGGIFVASARNSTIRNNRIADNQGDWYRAAGIALFQGSWAPNGPATGNQILNNTLHNNCVGLYVEAGSANNLFKNNLVTDSRTATVHIAEPTTVLDYNDYASTTALKLIWGSTPYTSLAAWQGATGQDRNSLSVDPLYVDQASGNLMLRSVSPVIDKGINVGLPYTGTAPDLGAFEFTGAPSPTAVVQALPAQGIAPVTVKFDASLSSGGSGEQIIGYNWLFGDGNTGAGQITSHVYTTPGIYSAVLSVTNSAGLTSEAKTSIVVTSPAPPSFSSVSPNKGSKSGGTLVTITGASFTPNVTVMFGGQLATQTSYVSPTTLTTRTPPHARGTVDVAVTTEFGTATKASGFTYTKY